MRYISLFSGIEAASVAWEPLGFEPVAFSEVDPFCNEVLALRFPNVPNLGDISQIDWRPYHGKVDVIVGGSPCQSFSVAGKRAGLLDDRGALMLEYVRAVREVGPTWSIWENVPGVLSQDRGRAFATLQRELEDCGYSLAWRVLDAQFFGVAQRRRRVFLIGHADPRCAAAVLFERESLLGNFKSSKEARTHFTAAARACAEKTSSSIIEEPAPSTNPDDSKILELYENHGKDARIKGPMPTCPTITALYGTGGNNTPLVNERDPSTVTYALVGNIIGRKPENGGNGSGYSEELCYTLTALDHHAVCHAPYFSDAQRHEPLVMGSGQACANVLEGLCPTQTARQYKDPPILLERSKASNHSTPQRSELPYDEDHPSAKAFFASNGEEYVGALCARDKYGIGYNCVDAGKVITEIDVKGFAPSAYVESYAQSSFAQFREGEVGTLCASGGCLGGGSETLIAELTPEGQADDARSFAQNTRNELHCESGDGSVTGALAAQPDMKQQTFLESAVGIRRLTPVECERLQGFPDNWTRIAWNGKPEEQCPNGRRYKALGNSMAVPVMRWIGQRMDLVDRLSKQDANSTEK